MGTPTWPSSYPADNADAWRAPRVVGPGHINGQLRIQSTRPPTGVQEQQPQQMPIKRPLSPMQAPSQASIADLGGVSVVVAPMAAPTADLQQNSRVLAAQQGASSVVDMAASAALQNLHKAVEGDAAAGTGAPGTARQPWRWDQVTPPPPAPSILLLDQQQQGAPSPPPQASTAAGMDMAGAEVHQLSRWSQDAPAPCPPPQQQQEVTATPPPPPAPAAQPPPFVPAPPSLTPAPPPPVVPASPPPVAPLSPAPAPAGIGSKPAWQAGRPVPLRLPAQVVPAKAAGPVCVQQATAVRAQVLSPRRQSVTTHNSGAAAPAADPAAAVAGAAAAAAPGGVPVGVLPLQEVLLEELLIVLDTNVWMLPEGRRMLRQMGPSQGWLPPTGAAAPVQPVAGSGGGAGAAAGGGGDVHMGEADPTAAAAAGSSQAPTAAQPAGVHAAAGTGAATGAGEGRPAAEAAGAQPAAPPARRKRVVVVVPLRVVSELDNLKSNNNKGVCLTGGRWTNSTACSSSSLVALLSSCDPDGWSNLDRSC
jgi:hypothetical protein